MSLIMPIFDNSERIGSMTATARRKGPGEPGSVSMYDWRLSLTAHGDRPPTDLENNPDDPVEHYYDDGCLELIKKVIEAAQVFV